MNDESKKWVMTTPMSLGFCRESVAVGAVIEEFADRIKINEKEILDKRDFAILKRQYDANVGTGVKTWIVPFSKEEQARWAHEKEVADVNRVVPGRKLPTDHRMEVVVSDEDNLESIDVSDTKVAENNRIAREAAAEAVRLAPMEVIQESTSLEELRKLDGKNDLASIEKRVKIKENEGIPKMRVVHEEEAEDEEEVPAVSAENNLEPTALDKVQSQIKALTAQIAKLAVGLVEEKKAIESLAGEVSLLKMGSDGEKSETGSSTTLVRRVSNLEKRLCDLRNSVKALKPSETDDKVSADKCDAKPKQKARKAKTAKAVSDNLAIADLDSGAQPVHEP